MQLWWLVQGSLFRWSPQFAYGFRRWLLRLFGARVGAKALIRPSATVTYPWKVDIGEHAWIGDDAVIYSLGPVHIGAHAVVSQRSYLCAADHDPDQPDFRCASARCASRTAPVATDVFVAPGVTVGREAVVGARSSVFRDLPPCHEPVRARGRERA